MTTIYFVRHAQPDFSIHDDKTRPLTEKGHQDAAGIVNRLDGSDIVAIYSSPYQRTIHTIQPFAHKHNLPITENFELRERSVGAWVEDFHDYSTKQWKDFDYKLENGESLRETQERNVRTITALLEKHPNESIVISTHGTALCTILNYFDAQYDFSYFQRIMNKMPLIVKAEFTEQKLINLSEI